jgi:hypothetical protein
MAHHNEHLQEFERFQMASHLGKWYSWDSPIGLSIFFLTLASIAAFFIEILK